MYLVRLIAIAGMAIVAACDGRSGLKILSITGGSPPNGSVVNVTIQDFSFSPTNVTIRAGTTVRWTNNGPSAHTATSDTGVWDSGTLSASGGTFDFTFTQSGTYTYHCTIHPPSLFPNFRGAVAVTP